jgi:hypothetical protein
MADQHTSGPVRIINASATGRQAPFGPRQAAMPDLSDVEQAAILNFYLNIVLRGTGPLDGKARIYLMNAIRLIDAAVEDYEGARLLLEEFCRRRTRLGLYYRIVTRLEACVQNVRRASVLLAAESR